MSSIKPKLWGGFPALPSHCSQPEQPTSVACSCKHQHMHFIEAELSRFCLTSVANAAIRSIATLCAKFSQKFHFLVACYWVWGFALVCLCLRLFVLILFVLCFLVLFLYIFLSSTSQNKPQITKPVLEKNFMLLAVMTIFNFLI